MSEKSYQLNVERGVTGINTNTCLPAAYDRITPRAGIEADTYLLYEQLTVQVALAAIDTPGYNPIEIRRSFRQVKERFRRELGVLSTKNIIEARATTKDDLYTTLNNLSQGGFRPAVYLDCGGLHAVGAMQLDDEHYSIRSTWSPFEEDEPVSVGELFEYLDQAPRLHRKAGHKTYKQANIVALPPEPRKVK